MQNVKRRSSISTSVDIRTVSTRCRLVLERRDTGVVVLDGSLEDEDGRVSSSPVVVDVVVDGLVDSSVTWAGDTSGSSLDVEYVVLSSSVDVDGLSVSSVAGIGDGPRKADCEFDMADIVRERASMVR